MTPRNGPFKQVMGVGWVRLGKIYQYICQVKKKHTVSHCCKNNATKVKKKKKDFLVRCAKQNSGTPK